MKGEIYTPLRNKRCSIYHDIIDYTAISSSKSQPLLHLVLLSGDIHPHPGPVKYPCIICERPVAKNHQALQCDSCDNWVHIRCDRVTKEEYKKFQNISSLVFECPKCNLFTFTDSFFLDREEQLINFSNSFQSLSDTTQDNDIAPEIHRKSKTPHHNRLRIININCRSLRSQTKQIELQDIIETHDPDIILGCESHLDPQISSSEVFPEQFSNPYRKDKASGEGGVFIATKNDLITTEIQTSSECEITRASINIQGSKQIIVGSYYRSPSSDIDQTKQLGNSFVCLFRAA
jgi:hypothetical protein